MPTRTKIFYAREKRPRVQLETGSDSRAKQEFKDECNINILMGRYLKSGQISHLNPREAAFLDVTEIGDYRTLLERGRQGAEVFERLPSEVRDQFNYDPVEFLDFASRPENADELVKLGLLPESELEARDEPPAPSGGAPPVEEESSEDD